MTDLPSASSPLKQAYRALEALQARLAAAERARHEPIAVIGLGCRFPGGAADPETFWQNLRHGVDAIREVPADRWDVNAVYDPDRNAAGKTYTRWGSFIDRVAEFDAQFFGIAPREASSLDPQQRLLLEVAWEALEHAAQAPDRLAGSRTGVFIGLASSDYAYLVQQRGDATQLDAYYGSGVAHSVASGRLSYVLGLQGPSISIDTACSSSLVAVHLAVHSLRNGECRMALAGGVHLALSPDNTIAFSKAHMLASDGRCKTFDARADGFAEGEGCGLVVLKKLTDALADGDRVLAVIRGTAINQDGPSSGLTAPNGPAQVAVIRDALADAQVMPADISYVEAHGTGTALGDPIEVQALAEALRVDRPSDRPFLLGSLKTNIGHLEAAAGVASLIKVVLMLQHGEIPPHLHFESPNPFIPWQEIPAIVPTTLQAWPRGYDHRRVGVSAFGFSGTNVHAIVEAAPNVERTANDRDRGCHLLTLSAKNETALFQQADRLSRYLTLNPTASLADVCFTANVGRAHLTHRFACAATSIDQLRDQLSAYAADQALPGVFSGVAANADRMKVAFLFTGQGSQYVNMGRQLYETQPEFRAAIDRCAEVLQPSLGQSLLAVLYPQAVNRDHPSVIDDTAYTQPALFALEYALAELWKAWGLRPAAVMGHSVGEYVAACVAGVFSLEDGLKLIAARGRLMQALPRGGAMAAVFAAEDTVAQAIAPFADRVSIAAINGPDHIVISGDGTLLQAILEQLGARGVKSKLLNVSHAFHSPLMEPMLDEFERVAAQVKFSAPRLRLISNVTGRAISTEVTQPVYWRKHVRAAVRFAESMAALQQLGCSVFVEIGPSPTLLGMGQHCLEEDGAVWLPSLRPGQDDWQTLLSSLARVYVQGAPVDWRSFDRPYARRTVALPTYPFQRERYWLAAAPRRRSIVTQSAALHPLLGRRLRSASSDLQFEAELSAETSTLLNDHRVFDSALLPAAAYLEVFRAAAQWALGREDVCLEDVAIHTGLIVPDGTSRLTQVIIRPEELGPVTLQFFSSEDDSGEWQLHASATARVAPAALTTMLARAVIQERCTELVLADDHYRQLRAHGLVFGPSLLGVRRIWRQSGEALGEIQLPDTALAEAAYYGLHPALLDACLQIVGAALSSEAGTYLPIGVDSFRQYRRPGAHVWSHALIRSNQAASHLTLTVDLRVFDEHDQLVAEATGLHFKRADRATLLGGADSLPAFADWLYDVQWQLQPRRDNGFMPDLATLVDRVQPLAEPLAEQHNLASYAELLPHLEALSLAYVVAAFDQLGWHPPMGQRVSAEALAQNLGVIDQHRRLFGRLLEILSEGEYVRREADGWEVTRELDVDTLNTRRQAAETLAPAAAELQLLVRCGSQLAAALRGEADPLQLLFPGGSLAATEQLYRHSPSARTYNALVAETINAALADLPPGRILRVLEIGAGTGGTTASVLAHLPADRTEYVYTDISPLFTAKAQQSFAAYPFVRYQTLDIEQDPLAQELSAHHYDVVVAANVIHATADLRVTLRHVQQLLAPEGLLVMIEVNQPQRWIDLTFGLTDGWWRFTDHSLRPAYPLLSRAQWLHLLTDLGFAQVAALPRFDRDSVFAAQSIVLARAPLTIGSAAGRWLIWADETGAAVRLAAALQDHGERSALIQHGSHYAQLAPDRWQIDPTQPADAARVLHEALGDEACRGVVHLWNLDQPHLSERAAELTVSLGSALHLVQALIRSDQPDLPRLWLITRQAQAVQAGSDNLAIEQSPVWGLGKTIALEHPELGCRRIDLGETESSRAIESLVRELLLPDREDQIAYRDGARCVARLVRSARPHQDRSPQRLEITTRGSFDHLTLVPLVRSAPQPGEVEIEVQATGLNFKDVMNVLAMYPGDPGLPGGECAGRITAVGAAVTDLRVGDAVMAVAGGCLGSFVIASAAFVARQPANLNVAEAASCAIPFITAHYTLNHLGHLQSGERVLIHAAAGGVGLAAVQLAQRAGAEIFATAGSPEKRAYLQAIGVPHVMDSRSLDFADEIMTLTHGRGVDVVLNSLAGEFIPRSLSVLADGGRFLEIGKSGLLDETQVSGLGRGIAYHIVDWSITAERDPALIRSLLLDMVALLENGELKPLPYRTFPVERAVDAFRYMAQAKHIGKLVVTQPHDISVRADGTYLITGGLGGLGLITARWLVEHGAQHVVLMSRHDRSAAAGAIIAELEARGVDITVWQGDVSRLEDVQRLLAWIARELPPLRGIFHAAGVLDDGALMQQDWTRFVGVMRPKIDGAWHLHQLTCRQPLDFFVMYSSAASLLGSAGQGNHAAANMFMDVLAHWRRAQGLPALSVNWGAWSEVGAAVEHGVDQRVAAQGVAAISPQQGARVLEYLLRTQAVQIGVMPIAWTKFAASFAPDQIPPFLAAVIDHAPHPADVIAQHATVHPPAAAQPAADWLTRISTAPAAKQRGLMIEYVRTQAGRVLGLDASRVGEQIPLSELGLDSLMAVELRNSLGTGLALPRKLPATLVFDYPTVAALADYVLREVAPPTEARPLVPLHPDQIADSTTLIDTIEDLSDEEVDRLLAGKLKR